MEGFSKSASKIRNSISQFDTVSIFGELIRYLQKTPEMKENGELSTPWVVLLAIDWVLELHPQSGKKVATQTDAHQILNRIWQTQHMATGTTPIYLQTRALFAPQVAFQRADRSLVNSLIRIRQILSTEVKEGEEFKLNFAKKFKVDFETFYEMAFMICLFCFKSDVKSIKFSVLIKTLLPKYSVSDLARVINLLSKTLSKLVAASAHEQEREIKDEEYFKESIFFKAPYLMTQDGLIIVQPKLALLGVSDWVIRNFIRVEENNRATFTKCFEEYISDIHDELHFKVVRENKLKEFYRLAKKANRKVVDFLHISEDHCIFIDAKGVDPCNAVLSSLRRYKLTKRIRDQHIKAIKQIIDCIEVLTSSNYPGMKDIDNVFGLVITHHDFYVGTGERVLGFLDEKARNEVLGLAEKNIHFCNIHFLTIEQYEQLLCICRETSVRLIDFFLYVKESEGDSKKIKMLMDMYVQDFSYSVYKAHKLPNAAPSLIREQDRMFGLAKSVYSSNEAFWKQAGALGDSGINYYLKCHEYIIKNTFKR